MKFEEIISKTRSYRSFNEHAKKVVIENADSSGDIAYWRDENNLHHVPKRSLDELIIEF